MIWCRFILLLFLSCFHILINGAEFPGRFHDIRLYTVDDGLSHSEITACFTDSRGLLWIGTKDGLNVFNGYEFRTFRHQPFENSSLSNNYILSIAEDPSGNIWIGTQNGLNLFNRQTGIINCFIHNPDESASIGGKEVYAIFPQHDNEIWLKTEKYFERLNPLDAKSVKYEHFYNESYKSQAGYATSIVRDVNGVFWFGSKDGLFSFSSEKELFTHYQNIPDNKYSLSNNEVNCLFQDSNDDLWIGTSSGLNRLNRQNSRFIRYSSNSGMPYPVYSINEDKNGILWLGAANGISYSINKDSAFTKIEAASFYKSGSLTDTVTAIGLDKSAILWLGTKNGLVRFDKKFLYSDLYNIADLSSQNISIDTSGLNTNIPEIVIWDLSILGPGEERHVYVGGDFASVTIQSNQIITIAFAALDYTIPEKNKFIYSLVPAGRKESWVNIGSQNKVTFSGLNSGEYIFRVRGSNYNGIWNNEGRKLIIIVETPFWRTSVARYAYLLFGVILIYSFIQTRTLSLRRSNRILRDRDFAAREVQKQKELLSLRNKNIEDSLKYAQRIQLALFSNQKAFKDILPHSFILHEPKDIVSGDFYWIFEKNDKIFLAAVDCTGHGVPGAFVSLIGFELFRKIIITQKVQNPARILDSLNRNFEEIFGGIEEGFVLKDGMDLSFCVIDRKTNLLSFSGAFNPIYIIRSDKLIEIKGDRFSIGADSDHYDENQKIFTSHNFQLETNDMLYLFSDGYPDQFGGPEGKKFKYRRFRHLLLTIHDLPPDKQKQYLKDSMEEWRGNYEQVDDILVIGIKPFFQS